MSYKGPHGQEECPRRMCNQGRMPYVQRSNGLHRVVCPCGCAGPWKLRQDEAVDGWNDLPRGERLSPQRPSAPGPHWCQSPGGHLAIVDLTEADVAGLTLTLGCYVAFSPILEPVGGNLS